MGDPAPFMMSPESSEWYLRDSELPLRLVIVINDERDGNGCGHDARKDTRIPKEPEPVIRLGRRARTIGVGVLNHTGRIKVRPLGRRVEVLNYTGRIKMSLLGRRARSIGVLNYTATAQIRALWNGGPWREHVSARAQFQQPRAAAQGR